MVTASRVTWFLVAFLFGLPIMLLMLRDDEGTSRSSWIQAVIFAAVMAAIVTLFLGKGRR
ncbi:hypothetical protein K7640_03950 [Micromonospora sp. PLK6-60]|uniref:hypothetical protein n=1 Tax=Micromonospora sp. PLK6-60 TaxID=2873383 RepID=UPI001CA6BA40|nr:hypothetical protein [Micromonospora sp. PLK6-60]MBY8870995.1 hypothetical protein [Micromonospora sp. PLK6-60]